MRIVFLYIKDGRNAGSRCVHVIAFHCSRTILVQWSERHHTKTNDLQINMPCAWPREPSRRAAGKKMHLRRPRAPCASRSCSVAVPPRRRAVHRVGGGHPRPRAHDRWPLEDRVHGSRTTPLCSTCRTCCRGEKRGGGAATGDRGDRGLLWDGHELVRG